jgi:hypothetical protein
VSGIDTLAAFAYSTGTDVLDYAEVGIIRARMDAHLNPDAFPGDVDPATAKMARLIRDDLIGAGWTPPQVTR